MGGCKKSSSSDHVAQSANAFRSGAEAQSANVRLLTCTPLKKASTPYFLSYSNVMVDNGSGRNLNSPNAYRFASSTCSDDNRGISCSRAILPKYSSRVSESM